MKTRTRIVLLLILLFVLAAAVLRIGVTSSSTDARRQSIPVVATESPQREAVVQRLELTGDLLPIQQAQVFAKVFGNLEAVYANMGDQVHKDQVLALIDTTELAQQYREAAATHENAAAKFERAKALQARNLTSQQEYDNAETAVKVASANFENARTRLDYARVAAPFSGFITRRFLDPGALLTSANATLFTLVNLDTVKVIVHVLEREVPLVKIGTPAVIRVDAYPERGFTGEVVRHSQALDLATRTMAVEVDVPNGERILKPGMFAAVMLVIGRREDVLTVPTQAVLRDAEGHFVYVADDTVARRRPVTVGAEQGSRTEIQSGLNDNDRVIVAGQYQIKDGGQIRRQP